MVVSNCSCTQSTKGSVDDPVCGLISIQICWHVLAKAQTGKAESRLVLY